MGKKDIYVSTVLKILSLLDKLGGSANRNQLTKEAVQTINKSQMDRVEDLGLVKALPMKSSTRVLYRMTPRGKAMLTLFREEDQKNG
jgi:DNA-binding PadR family transcriptional regulator